MFNTGFRKFILIAACAAIALASGCSGNKADRSRERYTAHRAKPKPGAEATPAPRAPETIPETVTLGAASVASGFATGTLREQVDVAAFRITRHPITRAQYGECVDAGACSEGESTGCAQVAFEQLKGRATAESESPRICSTLKEATSYCSWIGGRLPVFSQWLLAARGSSPQRYAWGDSAPTCERHPRVADVEGTFLSEEAAQEAGCVSAVEAKLVVGEHPAGAAASGMEDVLLTPAELLAPEANAQFAACSTGFAGCVVYGLTPGAIDAVYPIGMQVANAPADQGAPLVYGFRCALEEN